MVRAVGARRARRSDFFKTFHIFSLPIPNLVDGHEILRSQIVRLIEAVNMDQTSPSVTDSRWPGGLIK